MLRNENLSSLSELECVCVCGVLKKMKLNERFSTLFLSGQNGE